MRTIVISKTVGGSVSFVADADFDVLSAYGIGDEGCVSLSAELNYGTLATPTGAVLQNETIVPFLNKVQTGIFQLPVSAGQRVYLSFSSAIGGATVLLSVQPKLI